MNICLFCLLQGLFIVILANLIPISLVLSDADFVCRLHIGKCGLSFYFMYWTLLCLNVTDNYSVYYQRGKRSLRVYLQVQSPEASSNKNKYGIFVWKWTKLHLKIEAEQKFSTTSYKQCALFQKN